MIDLLPEARQHDRNVSPMSPNTCHRCPQFIQNQAEWPWSVNASMAENLSAVRFASLGEQVAFGLQLQGASIARRLRIVRLHASNPTLFPRTLQTLIRKSTRSKAGVIACSKCCNPCLFRALASGEYWERITGTAGMGWSRCSNSKLFLANLFVGSRRSAQAVYSWACRQA